MCTLVVIQSLVREHPVIVAANRDELVDRATKPFGRHWPDAPWRAGLDVVAGGTWAGLHDVGFGVFILNREHSLGPAPGKRSRGLLVLDLLEAGTDEAATARARAIDPRAYRPFLAIIASASGVTEIAGDGETIAVESVRTEVSMWTAEGRDSDRSVRQKLHRDAFERARAAHASGERTLEETLDRLGAILGRGAPEGAPANAALAVRLPRYRFGTRSGLLVAFSREAGPIVRVAEGPPDVTAFRPA